MKVELENEEDIIAEPAQEPVIDAAAEAAERARQLEIEKARLEGELNAMRKSATPVVDTQNANYDQAWADMNALSDDDFEQKWKVKKHQASSAILDHKFKTESAENQRRMASLQAENQLASQYGQDFFKYKDELKEALADAGPEVKSNPERLAKFMERTLKGYIKDQKPLKEEKPDAGRGGKRIVDTGFERPNGKPSDERGKGNDKDEIAAELAPIGRAFGLTSEKERKSLMESEFCRMDMGGGVVFEHPDKGFEKK